MSENERRGERSQERTSSPVRLIFPKICISWHVLCFFLMLLDTNDCYIYVQNNQQSGVLK